MDSMIEHVARAAVAKRAELLGQLGGRVVRWDDMIARERQIELAVARAAIAAMREPTKKMQAAGYGSLSEKPRLTWQAMIDSALKEGE